MNETLLIGAVTADPKGVTIWRTIRQHFLSSGVAMDYALFSSYAALDRAVLGGSIDIAWNAPLAQAQTLILGGGACKALAMRDTDREVATLVLARAHGPVATLDDLRGRRLALGVRTSSELDLIPRHQLRQQGIDVERECELVELEAAEYPGGGRWVHPLTTMAAIDDGAVDAATMFEPTFRSLVARGKLDPGAYRVVWRSGQFSHCGFAARPGLADRQSQRFVEVLTSMDYGDPNIKEMMDLEGLRAWVPADESGWQDLIAAVKEENLVGNAF
jgi:ABC-type phosphate/phosphonate transport system substrate-binding protein